MVGEALQNVMAKDLRWARLAPRRVLDKVVVEAVDPAISVTRDKIEGRSMGVSSERRKTMVQGVGWLREDGEWRRADGPR